MKFKIWIDQGACWDDDGPEPDCVVELPDESTEKQAALKVADHFFRTRRDYFDGSLIVQREEGEYHEVRVERVVTYTIASDDAVTLRYLHTGERE